MSWEQKCAEDARLVILAELARQNDGSLNSRNLAFVIEAVVPRRPREWVESQIAWLESMGALTTMQVNLPGLGPVIVARISRAGRDHVEQRSYLPGVSAPSDGG